jgi:UPF0271 protein
MNVIILDTSAFIQGTQNVADIIIYTVPGVRGELRDKLTIYKYENAVRNAFLYEVMPDEKYMQQVKQVMQEMGEEGVLSATDHQLLALGLQLSEEGKRPLIWTDDYSVQNMADRLGFKYKSLATQGIKKQIIWTLYCPGCKRRFKEQQTDNACPFCGTVLKRKPVKTKNLS